MTSLDLASREYSVPIRGSVVGVNYRDDLEQDMNGYVGGDFSRIGSSGPPTVTYGPIGAINPLRVLWPHYGQLTQCYADIKMTTASGDSGLQMKIAIGKLQSGNITPELSYTQEYIDSSWRKIRGSDTPLTVSGGIIEANMLDLMPALPKYGDDNYDRDLFVLLVCFNRAPAITSPFEFNIFNIHQSSTGVL